MSTTSPHKYLHRRTDKNYLFGKNGLTLSYPVLFYTHEQSTEQTRTHPGAGRCGIHQPKGWIQACRDPRQPAGDSRSLRQLLVSCEHDAARGFHPARCRGAVIAPMRPGWQPGETISRGMVGESLIALWRNSSDVIHGWVMLCEGVDARKKHGAGLDS